MSAEITELKREIEELKQRIRWFEAAHWLLANGDAFIFPEGASPFFWAEVDPQKGCSLALNMNDTFALATADAEPFAYVDAEELKRIAQTEGWPGLVLWVANKRGIDPHPRVQARMEEYRTNHPKTS